MIFSFNFQVKQIALTGFLGLLLAGCQPGPQAPPPGPAAAAAPFKAVVTLTASLPAPSVTAPAAETSPASPPVRRARYNLAVDYDPRAYQALVQEKITYANTSGAALDELVLVVDANRRPGQFQLKSVALAGAETPPSYKLDGMRLTIALDNPLQTGQETSLEVNYQLNLPDQALPLGHTPHQANFLDWYPFVPPYTPGTGWVVQPAAHVGEHLAYDLADFEVDIRLPDKTEPQVIAASAALESQGNHIQHFKLDGARAFAWSISPVYRLVTAQSSLAGGQSVRISGYVFPEHVEAGKAAAGYVARALSLFSTLFTPYQHADFSFVEVDFADGMESDGIFFLNKAYFAYTNGAQSGLCALSVHETSHQWWYGQVGNNQALDPWMDESLATYSELLYYQKVQPELADWWWSYRVAPYKPAGNVGSSIYDFQSYRPYVNTVYLHGVQFLDELHRQMGDDVFLAFLHNYAAVYGGRQVTPAAFFSLLRQSTSVDVQPAIDRYFTK